MFIYIILIIISAIYLHEKGLVRTYVESIVIVCTRLADDYQLSEPLVIVLTYIGFTILFFISPFLALYNAFKF